LRSSPTQDSQVHATRARFAAAPMHWQYAGNSNSLSHRADTMRRRQCAPHPARPFPEKLCRRAAIWPVRRLPAAVRVAAIPEQRHAQDHRLFVAASCFFNYRWRDIQFELMPRLPEPRSGCLASGNFRRLSWPRGKVTDDRSFDVDTRLHSGMIANAGYEAPRSPAGRRQHTENGDRFAFDAIHRDVVGLSRAMKSTMRSRSDIASGYQVSFIPPCGTGGEARRGGRQSAHVRSRRKFRGAGRQSPYAPAP